MTTLISLIGTGQRDITGNAYQRTIYQLPNGQLAKPTAIFTGALIEYLKPQAVVILGTRTSAWAALIEEYRSDYIDVYLRLEEGSKSKDGINDVLLQEAARALQEAWQIPVACRAVCHRNVDATNAADIMAICASAFPLTGEVVLDVTHSFRSLAMLAQAAAHVLDAVRPGISARTQIMYGDLITHPARGITPAKDGPECGQGKAIVLETLTRASALTSAAQSAHQCLDFEPLAACIDHRELKKSCQKVALSLRSLDLESLATNIPKFLSHLHKSADPLLKIIAQDFELMLQPFVGCNLPCALVNLAQLAFDRGLWSLSLFAAYEASCVYALNNSKVKLHQEMDIAWTVATQQLPSNQRNILDELSHARNQSAHGSHRIKRDALDPRAVLGKALPVLKSLIH